MTIGKVHWVMTIVDAYWAMNIGEVHVHWVMTIGDVHWTIIIC